jgi:hypothetical protein
MEAAMHDSQRYRGFVPNTDERVEAFLKDSLGDEGKNPNVVRENTRRHLVAYEQMFRDGEVDKRKKNGAARRCRELCRQRAVEQIFRCKDTQTEAHLQIVLSVIERLPAHL